LLQPLAVQTRRTRQAMCAINQSIFPQMSMVISQLQVDVLICIEHFFLFIQAQQLPTFGT